MEAVIISVTAVLLGIITAYVISNLREFQHTECIKTYYRHEVSEHARGNQNIPRKIITRQSKHYKNC